MPNLKCPIWLVLKMHMSVWPHSHQDIKHFHHLEIPPLPLPGHHHPWSRLQRDHCSVWVGHSFIIYSMDHIYWIDIYPWWHSWRRKCNPLQYFCWENPMNRGAWRATVSGVTKSGHNWATEHNNEIIIDKKPLVNLPYFNLLFRENQMHHVDYLISH